MAEVLDSLSKAHRDAIASCVRSILDAPVPVHDPHELVAFVDLNPARRSIEALRVLPKDTHSTASHGDGHGGPAALATVQLPRNERVTVVSCRAAHFAFEKVNDLGRYDEIVGVLRRRVERRRHLLPGAFERVHVAREEHPFDREVRGDVAQRRLQVDVPDERNVDARLEAVAVLHTQRCPLRRARLPSGTR